MPRQCRIVACSHARGPDLHDVITVIVRFAVVDPGLHAAAGHPHREAARMMIAAVVVLGQPALAVDGAAEFSAPDDQRVVEHAALLQILNQAAEGWSVSLQRFGRPSGSLP